MKNPENYTIVAGKHYSNIHRKHKSAEIRKVCFRIGFSFYRDSNKLIILDKAGDNTQSKRPGVVRCG